jgi:hypothetical protein
MNERAVQVGHVSTDSGRVTTARPAIYLHADGSVRHHHQQRSVMSELVASLARQAEPQQQATEPSRDATRRARGGRQPALGQSRRQAVRDRSNTSSGRYPCPSS